MAWIYKTGRSVIVWLGPTSHTSHLAMQTLKRISEGIVEDKQRKLIIYKLGSWAAAIQYDTIALKSHANCSLAIKDLLTRGWFSRLWVFQEIALAQKAYLVIGEDCLDWEISTIALEWVRMMASRLDQQIKDLHIHALLESLIRWFLSEGCNPFTLNVFDALEATGTLLCSDLRDRLFGIRSLLAPESPR